jgi:hypothetical protein
MCEWIREGMAAVTRSSPLRQSRARRINQWLYTSITIHNAAIMSINPGTTRAAKARPPEVTSPRLLDALRRVRLSGNNEYRSVISKF